MKRDLEMGVTFEDNGSLHSASFGSEISVWERTSVGHKLALQITWEEWEMLADEVRQFKNLKSQAGVA